MKNGGGGGGGGGGGVGGKVEKINEEKIERGNIPLRRPYSIKPSSEDRA